MAQVKEWVVETLRRKPWSEYDQDAIDLRNEVGSSEKTYDFEAQERQISAKPDHNPPSDEADSISLSESETSADDAQLEVNSPYFIRGI